MAHVKAFTKVLKLAMDVNTDAFSKAHVSRSSGVTQTPVSKQAALIQKLRQAIWGAPTPQHLGDLRSQTADHVGMARVVSRRGGEECEPTDSHGHGCNSTSLVDLDYTVVDSSSCKMIRSAASRLLLSRSRQIIMAN
jgi:hypothetical protein